MIIAGTGSRSFKAKQNQIIDPSSETHKLDVAINKLMGEELDELTFMSGMAEGWDEFIAEYAIYHQVPFIAAIPNPGYGRYYWADHSVSGEDRYLEFTELREAAHEVVYVCQGIYENGVHANFVRNQYMVDRADAFVVWNPTSRGTADCVRRIKKAGKPYIVIGE